MTSHSELKRVLLGLVERSKKTVQAREEEYKSFRYAYETRLEHLKEQTQKSSDLSELLGVKKTSLEVLNTLSTMLEETSIRRSIEKILHQVFETLFECDDFNYVFQRKKNRNQQELYIYKQKIKDGKSFLIPISSTGGGARDIIDIIIRILVLRRCAEDQRVLILDEPMKNLSKNFRQRFFEFLKELCDNFKIQLIMITHETEYIDFIDNVFRLKHDGNKTVIE